MHLVICNETVKIIFYYLLRINKYHAKLFENVELTQDDLICQENLMVALNVKLSSLKKKKGDRFNV